jgi:hypothetical protein
MLDLLVCYVAMLGGASIGASTKNGAIARCIVYRQVVQPC